MSGLLALLQNSAQSLQAQQAYSSTVAHNLSNSNTPGYARQRADLAATLPAERYGSNYIGRGAVLQAITQSRDRFVEAQMPDALGREQFTSAQAGVLQGVSALDPDGGLSTALGSFYSSMRALARDPGSMNYRQAAVSASTQLAMAFNRVGGALGDARTAIDRRVEATLPSINEDAAQLARLNQQIQIARTSGGSPNDLLDARQRLADSLAQRVGATPVPTSAGDLNLVLANGVAIVAAGQSAQFSALPDPANGGHLAVQLTLTDGSGPTTLSQRPSGELGGLLEARDVALASAEQRVDQMAYDVGNAVNTAHAAGFALDGSTGRNLFTVSGTSAGAARSLGVNAAITNDASLLAAASSAATTPGDGTALQALVDTERQALTGGLDVETTLADITSQYGATTSRVMSQQEGDSTVLSHLTTMRESASGVSVDEELVEMQRAQRGYEAIAKVITTADKMLDTLMQLT